MPRHFLWAAASTDVFPDGKRFVMFKAPAADTMKQPTVVVVQNWVEELRRRVPTQ